MIQDHPPLPRPRRLRKRSRTHRGGSPEHGPPPAPLRRARQERAAPSSWTPGTPLRARRRHGLRPARVGSDRQVTASLGTASRRHVPGCCRAPWRDEERSGTPPASPASAFGTAPSSYLLRPREVPPRRVPLPSCSADAPRAGDALRGARDPGARLRLHGLKLLKVPRRSLGPDYGLPAALAAGGPAAENSGGSGGEGGAQRQEPPVPPVSRRPAAPPLPPALGATAPPRRTWRTKEASAPQPIEHLLHYLSANSKPRLT